MSEPKQFRATATCAMLEGPHFETFYEPMVFECFVRYKDYAALAAKVERLTKAGIAMGMALPDTDEANAAYRSFERVVRS